MNFKRTVTRVRITEDDDREQMRRINRRLRGLRDDKPQPCTCAVDHGWHA